MNVADPLRKPLPALHSNPKRSFLRFFSIILVIANLTSIILSTLFLLNIEFMIPNVFGIILLFTLLGNIALAGIPGDRKKYDLFYLNFTILVMTLLPVFNTMASVSLSNTDSLSFVSIFLLFSLLVLGGLIALIKRGDQTLIRFDSRFPVQISQERHFSKAAIITMFFWSLCLLGGIYVAFVLLVGKTGGAIEMIFPGYTLFFCIGTLAIVSLILRMGSGKNRGVVASIILPIIGFVVAACFSVPVISTLLSLEKTEGAFVEAFGDRLDSRFESESSDYFLTSTFSLPNYFFGTKTGKYIVKEDILFYEGVEGVDEGIQLRFDAYLPPDGSNPLPGNNSVLIRIHGGGWTIGDKGASNNAQVNKYFANQGYVVFDVQYGLSSEDRFVEFAPVPEQRVGDFTIDDMVRHIGLFTDYLVEHNDEFQGDLDSVFVSGASAGGQLASAVGLGLASGNYEDVLNPELHVKGIIPIYPANGLAGNVGIGGSEALVDPALLVKEDSPPALIFQGTADGVVDLSVAETFANMYRNNNNQGSVLLEMPYAGHNGDFYFSSYYNQVFIYYMERFMYLHRRM
ncbi:alpha/beta hydrolase [Evansella sp. AB-rgal1]|uniref:alpha/beta hydrolase n=1 Tax=Evansella sp. AB-rgal1 TaxID=3242696 RepID=UPI00359D7C17